MARKAHRNRFRNLIRRKHGRRSVEQERLEQFARVMVDHVKEGVMTINDVQEAYQTLTDDWVEGTSNTGWALCYPGSDWSGTTVTTSTESSSEEGFEVTWEHST